MVKYMHIMILLACFWGICFPSNAEPAAKKTNKAVTKQGYQSVSETRLRECFIKYLCRHSGKEQPDIIASKFKVNRNRTVPKGKVSIRLSRKGSKRLAGYVRLNAIVSVNGIEKTDVQLSAWVDVFESIVCTSRDLKRKEIIKKGDVYLERKNISHMPPNTISELSKAVGLMIKHNVKADTCLKAWMLEKPSIVERGDIVTILAESGGLRVTVPGRVLEKGYLGELIKVQNAMSKKEVYAKVINNLTVMVSF
ncbi:MAG: flagellar basal body P-ring formation protein FlgA [Deltaproteobacteria bacterium]|nr:flagellar basal body P-ring formation protein FlgA [Deltaproteobacteria bacterium]